MADLGGEFDTGAVDDDRELLPDGEVLLQIVESELKQIENGKCLNLGWQVLSGPLEGRKLWTSLNIQHNNAQAQEFAQRDFKRITVAAFGEDQRVRNSDVLHFKPMLATILTRPARTDPKTGKSYDAKNELRSWKFYGPTPNAPASPGERLVNGPMNPAPATAAAPKSSVPWPTR